jgi:hypothetical protein
MKKLSDYQGDEAIELWADLLEPLTSILGDDKVQKVIKSGKPKTTIAKEILKSHKKEATEIMLRIDPEPINGLNIVLRLVGILADIGQSEEIKSFFGFAEQEQTEAESFGSVTESTKAEEK